MVQSTQCQASVTHRQLSTGANDDASEFFGRCVHVRFKDSRASCWRGCWRNGLSASGGQTDSCAREAGIAAGSLESLARGRLKFTHRIADKLNALLVRKITERIASLERELAIAKAIGGASQVDLERAEMALEEARKAIGK